MYRCLRCFLVLTYSLGGVLVADGQLLRWRADNKLTWADFKGLVNTASTRDAHSRTIIRNSYDAVRHGRIYQIKFGMMAGFDRAGSWVRPNAKTTPLLKHEQLHFDITELFARKLYIAYGDQVYTNNYKQQMKRIYSDILLQAEQMQDRYDAETDHSRRAGRQLEWEVDVARQLRETPTYPK